MGMQKYFLAFGYAKKFHEYAMRCIRSMGVDVGVPCTSLMVEMIIMMSYTD